MRREGQAAKLASAPLVDRPETQQVLVLGIGNLLLSDEGIGVHAVSTFAKEYCLPANVTAVDGGTAGMDLLDTIAGITHLIVVDAARTGSPPGTISLLRGRDVASLVGGRVSPHQLGLVEVLGALVLLDSLPQTISIIAVEPECLDLGATLSAALVAAMPAVIDAVINELATLGICVEAKVS